VSDRPEIPWIAEYMNRLPDVLWDRCVVGDGEGCVFGWVERPGGRHDFVLLRWTPAGVGLTTSSAERGPEFARALGIPEPLWQPLRGVEEAFGTFAPDKIVRAA